MFCIAYYIFMVYTLMAYYVYRVPVHTIIILLLEIVVYIKNMLLDCGYIESYAEST